MIYNQNNEKILFIDIETVPRRYEYKELDSTETKLWNSKIKYKLKGEETAEDIYNQAGIYAEFGKIVCISMGYLKAKTLTITSLYHDDEIKILNELKKLLESESLRDYSLCAHNGKEFDFPYLARRFLINGIKLPEILNIAKKKPWEINHIDTMELWKFGDYKHYTSLELLAYIFNIESSKSDISGDDVARVYWEEGDLKRIVKYCEGDVKTVAQVYLKYNGREIIPKENIKYKDYPISKM